MRIKLLVATNNADYTEHISSYISENYSDAIVVSVCRTNKHLRETLSTQKFDVALVDSAMIEELELTSVSLPMLLVSEEEAEENTTYAFEKIIKYQRISLIVAELLENCAKVSKYGQGTNSEKACITAIWSPGGGVGKTSVALSYATKKVSEGKQVLYLNLEPFSSVPAYFYETGKSISAVFEMLENSEGNIKMLIRGICQQDSAGVAYFCRPENFDDMYALSAENIAELTTVCAGVTEELVIDMSCVCDWRTRKVFELADKIFLVTDATRTAEVKLSQFITQHTVYEKIKEKTVFIANKGATAVSQIKGPTLYLPFVQSTDPATVYKSLTANFDM